MFNLANKLPGSRPKTALRMGLNWFLSFFQVLFTLRLL